MMHPKDFYRTYSADNNITSLNRILVDEIIKENPVHVLEFGCGSGKNLKLLFESSETIVTIGVDISYINIMNAIYKNDQSMVMIADEGILRNLCNIDVVFCCSVLDHIQEIGEIIGEFKRICNKAVIIAETQIDSPNTFYYRHVYEDYGFVDLGYDFVTDTITGDGNIYRMWKYKSPKNVLISHI